MRTRRLAATIAIATLWLAAADANASSLQVRVTPDTPGTAAAPVPVAVRVSAELTGPTGRRPLALRGLTAATPDGFTTALAGTTSCSRAALESAGSAGCPQSSKLGSGDASFIYVSQQFENVFEVPASTSELSVFRGAGDEVLAYALVTHPARFSVVVPGRLIARPPPLGPIVALDFSATERVASGYVLVTRATFELTRGLAAGTCPARRWTFGARLAYANGTIENLVADAPCRPDVTPPELLVTARNGTPALGARFAVRLSEAAKVRVTIERRSGRGWVRVRKATLDAAAGSSVLRVRRAGGRALARGRYRARLRAVDDAGLDSDKVTVTFRLR